MIFVFVFRSIADRFDVSMSTLRECVYRTCRELEGHRQKFISWPDKVKAQKTMTVFEGNNGFPGIIGCIDGCHIPIVTPSEHQDSYVNRKGFHSIILQGVCDDQRRFIDVECGTYPRHILDHHSTE